MCTCVPNRNGRLCFLGTAPDNQLKEALNWPGQLRCRFGTWILRGRLHAGILQDTLLFEVCERNLRLHQFQVRSRTARQLHFKIRETPTLVRHVVSQTTSAPPAQSSDRGAGKQTARSRVAFVGIGLLEVRLATQMIFMKKTFPYFFWLTLIDSWETVRALQTSGGFSWITRNNLYPLHRLRFKRNVPLVGGWLAENETTCCRGRLVGQERKNCRGVLQMIEFTINWSPPESCQSCHVFSG
jgi:hypothetical protein